MGKKGKGKKGGSKKSNKGKNYETLDDDYSNEKNKGKKNSHGKKGGRRHGHHHTAFISTADDLRFRQSVEEGGSHSIIDVASDGNCLFRSISDQLYHDYGKMHDEVRNDICDLLESHEEEFSVFLVLDENEEDEDASSFEAYISAMREDGEWGGNLELVGGARLYRRNITVFSSVGAAFTIEHGPEKSSGPDLIVSYHDNDHYNSVRNSAFPFPSLPSKFMPEKAKNPQEDESSIEEDEGSIKEKDVEKEDSETEKTAEEEEDKAPVQNAWGSKNTISVISGEESDKKSDTASEPKRKPRAKEPCPCQSGKIYKKCCASLERSRKFKEKNGIKEDDTSKDLFTKEEEEKMNGNFKVLKI